MPRVESIEPARPSAPVDVSGVGVTEVDVEGIVLTGTRGAGKSTVARALDAAGSGVHVRAVTTRGPRLDDEGHYDYLSPAAFEEEQRAGVFLVVARYGEDSYGARDRDALAARAAGLPPILTLTPAAAASFLTTPGRQAWVGVFLDAPDAVLDARLAARGAAPGPTTRAQRAADRAAAPRALPRVVNDRPPEETVAVVASALAGRPVVA